MVYYMYYIHMKGGAKRLMFQGNGKKANAVYIGLKLNKRTDADILNAIGPEAVRQKELKRLIRLGMSELRYCCTVAVKEKEPHLS